MRRNEVWIKHIAWHNASKQPLLHLGLPAERNELVQKNGFETSLGLSKVGIIVWRPTQLILTKKLL